MTAQSERLAEILKKLRVDVTHEDRKSAKEKFMVTDQTITNYINGRVKDNDTATSFIVFFKERIAERDRMTSWVPPLVSDKQIARQEEIGV